MSNVLDGDYATNLQKILKVSTSIFMCLSAEWSRMHHVDEAWLELKLEIVGFECWSSANVLGAWSREFMQGLASHSLETGVKLPLDLVDSD